VSGCNRRSTAGQAADSVLHQGRVVAYAKLGTLKPGHHHGYTFRHRRGWYTVLGVRGRPARMAGDGEAH